jgi:Rhodanese-like domain
MAFQVNWKQLWLPLLAIAITVGVLWFTNRAVTPREPTWDDVVAEAKDGGYRLINTDEFRQRYEKDPRSILLVDTRQEWEFAMGHITGAMNFPMEPTRWSRWWKKGDLGVALGPDKNRFIVFY